MNHFLGTEEQFPAVEESCGRVGDVSRTNKGRTSEIDVVTEIRSSEIEPTLKSYIIYSEDFYKNHKNNYSQDGIDLKIKLIV